MENNIGAEGAKMISEVLKSNSTLTKLNLGGDEKRNVIWIEEKRKCCKHNEQ